MFTKLLYCIVHNLPREYKYTLGEDAIRTAWNCLDKIVEINSLPDSAKAKPISELSAEFDRLKLRIRMAQEIQLISEGQFAAIQEVYFMPIGQMIGGWKNWADNL